MAATGPIEQIQAVIDELAPRFGEAANIHKYTRIIGAKCKTVRQFENDYALTQPTTLDEVIKDIQYYSNNDDNVNIALATIRAQGAAIEPETGLNIPALLISTWSLATTCHYTNACDLVIDNLRHNKATGGGCPAGISARLVLPYLHFLKSSVEAALGYTQEASSFDEVDIAIAESLSSVQNDEDSQLQAAMEASKQDVATQINEAMELALAMALSQASQFTPAYQAVAFDISALTEDEQLEHAMAASLRNHF